jgi:peptidoglycan/LPS O-acetylase OafA/YrhL
MYIFHVPILAVVRPALFQYLQKYIPHSAAFALDNLLCLILVIAMGQITWHLIEKPALKLKKFFRYNLSKPDSITYTVVQQPPIIINDVINK